MLYRIYTEWKEDTIKGVTDIVSSQFEGFSVFNGTGLWQGKAESCVMFEIISDVDIGIVNQVAERIREYNKQQCVMVAAQQIAVRFI